MKKKKDKKSIDAGLAKANKMDLGKTPKKQAKVKC